MDDIEQKIYNRINVRKEAVVTVEREFILLCEKCICPAILLGNFYTYSKEIIEYSPLGPYCDPAIYNTLEGISDWYLGLFSLSDIKWAIEYLVYKEYIIVETVVADKQSLLKIEANVDKVYEDSRNLEVEPHFIHDQKYASFQAHMEAESVKRREKEREANPILQKTMSRPTKIDPAEAEKGKVQSQNKRAKNARLLATLTLDQWLETLKHFKWRCAYCKKGNYTVLEHFVPIIHGGGTTWDNCVPSCTRCNAIKQSWNPLADWGPGFTGIEDGIEVVRAYLETRKNTEQES